MKNATAQPERTLDKVLDGLLIAWFEHFRAYTLNKGHSTASATTIDYRTPGHHDWKNGAADERAEDLLVRGVDRAMQRVPNEPHRWRTALEFQARNLHGRLAVWSSPVLPATKAERDVLLLEARNRLVIELKREGTIG